MRGIEDFQVKRVVGVEVSRKEENGFVKVDGGDGGGLEKDQRQEGLSTEERFVGLGWWGVRVYFRGVLGGVELQSDMI